MRNPNGYGSVVKLSGRRRKPYMVRKTTGYDERGYPIYAILGYTATRAEGNIMLAEYNKSPYDLNAAKITVADLHERWMGQAKLSENYMANLASAWNKVPEGIRNMPYKDLRLSHLQELVNGIKPTVQQTFKGLFHLLDEYALKNDLIQKGYAEFIDTDNFKTEEKTPFSEEEIQLLWQHTDDEMCCHALILIYSGWRITEYLTMAVDLTEGIMTGGIKTAAGKGRKIPIHSRTRPLLEKLTKDRKLWNASDTTFRREWASCLADLGMKHIIHETRHTFVSRLDRAGVPRLIIDKLAGHASGNTGERVYTHKDMDELREAVEKLP